MIDYIIGFGVAALVVFVIARGIRRRKRGEGGCGCSGCSSCAGCSQSCNARFSPEETPCSRCRQQG